ncbi:MAG: hypothetical protein E5W91_21600 [Mesorhizobium sp.]|nr:MAG: hypothetical protein E5W91_21600 [Mesorhizobium sp.]TIS85789.1 MAG: hypothetical protein E5W89_31790 [Mesorhizobium sp.]
MAIIGGRSCAFVALDQSLSRRSQLAVARSRGDRRRSRNANFKQSSTIGQITPVAGALLQEGIDIVVILNALRTLGDARLGRA